MTEPDDPRVWPLHAPAEAAPLHALAARSLGAATAQDSDAADADIRARLRAFVDAGDGAALGAIYDTAPGAAVYRHLWRQLAQVEAALGDTGLATTVFALPLVIVAGTEEGRGETTKLPGVLCDAGAIAALLREHGALAGNRTFGFANALVAADALAPARLPGLLARRAAPDAGDTGTPLDLPPAPIALAGVQESVHLRFLVGAALAAPGVDLLAATGVGAWGMPLTRALGGQIALPGTTVLALPHAPTRLATAVHTGRALQREVSAQLFVSNALRRFRAGVGEPSAVISAHRRADAAAGGELRLSLSSPFGPRDAEGFRCPLYATDRSADDVQMLAALLRDCRVADVRIVPGLHADRDPATDIPLLFKADALH